MPEQNPQAAASRGRAGLPTGGVLALLNPAHPWFLLVGASPGMVIEEMDQGLA